ncbi:Dos2-interacting transcription regulator of RNA-Pol-II-domain-containing protein [Calycina marina]|uniref:MMS19 nucleotide excision repair protein n=1 Tax=Calycina marina TaxID=1763456 RepID=A0A9P7Z2Q1_9HELO|nr:Dos2-interacting transcription regulator of RNA-Pol-II-domain-containing protein [Calycina marina]
MASTIDNGGGGAPLPHAHRDRTVQECLETELDSEHATIVQDIAGRIDLGVYTITALVRDTQYYITENAPLPQVARAMGIMAEILAQVQVPLARADIHVFAQYLWDRLINSGSDVQYRAGVQQSAEALGALINMGKNWPRQDSAEVVTAVFAVDGNGVLKDLKASGRLSLLKVLALLVKEYAKELKRDIGGDNVGRGLVSMAQLEKDPSCLRVLFGMYEELGKSWELQSETYVLIWESYVRYFPITLAKAATDPSVPKPDELRALLAACFVSNDIYAPEAFPRLIDMLDTNQDLSANTKKDVFDTMVACISGYGFAVVLEWAPKIWESIKFEIWNGENEDFISSSLKVINALGKKLSTNIQDWDDELNIVARFVIGILKECTGKILDSRQRFMLSTGRIIHALSCASMYMFSWLPKKVLPSLLTLWGELSLNSEKTSLLDVFNRGLQARYDVESQLMADFKANTLNEATIAYSIDGGQRILKSLAPFKERLVEVYWSALRESAAAAEGYPAFRINTIQGLASLMSMKDFLSDMERGAIIDSLNGIVLAADQRDDIFAAATVALKEVSIADPERYRTITLPHFMSKFAEKTDEEAMVHILDPLLQISCTSVCTFESKAEPDAQLLIFNAYQRCLLDLVSKLSLTETLQLVLLLSAIRRGIELFDNVLKSEPTTSSATHPYFFIVYELFAKFVVIHKGASVAYVGLKGDTTSIHRVHLRRALSLLGDIATLALRSSQTTAANNFLYGSAYFGPSRIWTLFCDLDKDLQTIGQTQMDVQRGPKDKCMVMALSMSLIAGVRREDKNRLGLHIGEVAKAMIQNVVQGDDNSTPYTRVAALEFLQVLVNKFGASSDIIPSEDGITLAEYLEKMVESTSSNTDNVQVNRIYQTLAYYTTAAVNRCDPSDRKFVKLMVEGIPKRKLGKKVAQSFRMLMAPSSGVLDKANFAIVRPLRQGRLYAYVVDDLVALWRTSPHAKLKSKYMVALVGVLSFLKPSVYLENADAIFPLLLEGTNIEDDDWTKLACITCIRTIIPFRPKTVTSHLDSVISRMTDRTRNTYFSPSDSNVQCRSAAIDVLALLTKHIEGNELMRRKSKVIIELNIAVDDMSTVVRDGAQRCKLAWFNLAEGQ